MQMCAQITVLWGCWHCHQPGDNLSKDHRESRCQVSKCRPCQWQFNMYAKNNLVESLKDAFKNGFLLGPCTVGECADPAYEVNLVALPPAPLSTSAIAGIAVASVVGLVILLLLLFAKVQQMKLRRIPPPVARPGVQLSWRDLSYSVANKQVLSEVAGTACSGRLLAILGPSGAGKSTFLDILAGKSKSGKVGGGVFVNGKSMSPRKFRGISGYVDQEDLLVASMTVRETLLFSANLRLPEGVAAEEKERVVDDVLESLGIYHIRDSKIGGGGIRGISGGEKRRVSIGVELVTSPSVLFLDEPTSGIFYVTQVWIVSMPWWLSRHFQILLKTAERL